jgi:hypothetical protein
MSSSSRDSNSNVDIDEEDCDEEGGSYCYILQDNGHRFSCSGGKGKKGEKIKKGRCEFSFVLSEGGRYGIGRVKGEVRFLMVLLRL